MGLFDGLKSVLGMKAEADATRDADPDDLFGMSTAYITMEAELDFAPTGEAALCFADVDSTDFQDAIEEVETILDAGKVETGTQTSFETDDHGYQWIIFEDDQFEDLLTSIHFAADTLVERRYGSRLLAALFSFERERDGQPAYWVYSFRRGSYYPFAPDRHDDRERDTSAEFKLESNLKDELSLETEKEYWYPLWPDRPGYHPWE